MRWFCDNCRVVLGMLVLCVGSEPLAKEVGSVIQLDETVISGNQELPKVLYIVPWQQPVGLPEIEVRHDFTERDVFRALYPPAYRRELNYFETLQIGNLQGHNTED